ncbi:ATPase-like protein [Streptomyces sp. OM5714]|nr:ATPase-like protein [Streptomyces sp. OM5714]
MLTYAAAAGGRLDIGLPADVQGLAHEQPLLVDNSAVGRLVVRHADPGDRAGGHCRLPDMVLDVLLGTPATSSRQLPHSTTARVLTVPGDADPRHLAGHPRAAGPMAPAAARRRSGRSLPDHEL